MKRIRWRYETYYSHVPSYPLINLLDPLNKLVYVPTGEVINLGDESKPCPKLDLVEGSSGTGLVGTFIGGKVVMCASDSVLSNYSCFSKSNSKDEWLFVGNMSWHRKEPTTVNLSDDEWWLTGGYNGYIEESGITNTTEIYTTGVGFSPFIDLHDPRFRHNVVKINSTHLMVVGGDCHGGKCKDSWMFDRTNQLWTLLPDSGLDWVWTYAGLVNRS